MTNGNILDKRFFYVGRSKTLQITQGCADSPEQFMDTIKASRLAWLDYQVDDVETDAYKIAEKFGFSRKLVAELLKDYRSGYEDFDNEMGLKVPAMSVEGMDVVTSPVIVLIRKPIILTIHGEKVQRFIRFRRYAEVYMRKIPKNKPLEDRMTLLLCRILDENNGRNFDHLREIEEQGDKMSKWMMDPTTPRSKLGPEIYKMKHSLIVYLNGLWATLDVINSMRYGDAELLSDDQTVLRRVELLSSDVNQQISLSEHMSEVLASGLEVLQSIYNNQLQVFNNRMAFGMTYLTILGTAVLVPNTIATVMSNPAFAMTPSDEGWYIALIVGSTILSTVFAAWWVRRQGWFPKRTQID
ncbi:CorA-like Mg2+ transporter protein [Candidatus Norongarragalina meridionalis]|nr:CorA-like Mg2+ transporter protein [Candidatus Norongarragalina meridionalis]